MTLGSGTGESFSGPVSQLAVAVSNAPVPGLRSGKDFRAFKPDHDKPIQADSFDVEQALSAKEEEDRDAEQECQGHAEDDLELDEFYDVEFSPVDSVPDPRIPFAFLDLPPPLPSPFVSASLTSDDELIDQDEAEVPEMGKAARCKRKRSRNRAKRALKRSKRMRELGSRLKDIACRRAARAIVVETGDYFETEDLPVNSTEWAGIRLALEKSYGDILDELGEGYELRLVDWDGCQCHAIVDKRSRVIAILAGRPMCDDWDQLMKDAAAAVEEARRSAHFMDKQLNHRRGDFPAVAIGISYGGGQKRPGVLKQSKAMLHILLGLLAHPGFQRLAGFANCVFEVFAANTFGLYRDNMDELLSSNPKLWRNFKNMVFAACTFNFGPYTQTYPHTDSSNLAWGWCAITALGSFDPDRGSHLVLWDLGLVIRFPPGSTILIPSALLIHSNVPICAGESRYSFVQYTAAGLFRWVDNCFMSDKEFMEKASYTKKKRREDTAKSRWVKGLGMFSLWNDIVAAGRD